MSAEIWALSATAAAIGVTHTLLGPDHYLPFVAMARAGRWSSLRTAMITTVCGIGHVMSSVVLGFAGIALGIAVSQLESVESRRGDIAAWGLVLFGVGYLAWGLWRAGRHEHSHSHGHTPAQVAARMTPWILFTVFVFGPCEPLIPILMFPAASSSLTGCVLVTGVFALSTIGTMLAAVWLLLAGVQRIPLAGLERHAHAIAGATISLCGLAIFLGL